MSSSAAVVLPLLRSLLVEERLVHNVPYPAPGIDNET
jgi:hypothetical protein